MRQMQKRWGALALSAALAAGVGCSRTVEVLVPVPMTGGQATQGQDVVNGVQLAAGEWNAKGGVLGRQVLVTPVADEGDKDAAFALAREWGNRKVPLVVGHYHSASTLAAVGEYAAKRTLMITATSTNASVTREGYPNIFRVCGRDDQQGQIAAAYAAKYFPGARVAIVHDKSAYGQELANQFLGAFKGKTGLESLYYGGVPRGGSDFGDVLAKLKDGGPAVVFFGGLYEEGAALLKALRAAGVTAPFLTGDGCYDPAFLRAAGADGEGALVSFYPDLNTPAGKPFVQAYTEKFGKAPGPYSVFAYTAATVAFQAMTAADSTDCLTVAKALHGGRYETPLGPLSFAPNGDPANSPYVLWKVEGGKFVPVDMNAPAPPPPPQEPAPAPVAP